MAANTNRQGAAFELDVMHYLAGCDCESTRKTPVHVGWEGFGYDVLRSSGSRGAVDVVAVGQFIPNRTYHPNILLFIQCKINVARANLSPYERARVQDLALRAGAVPLVAYRAVDENNRRMRPHFRILTGPGPKDWAPWAPGEDD